MSSCRVGDVVPCGYLVASRYPGVVPVVGFVWLEMLPMTAMLAFFVGWYAFLYPLLQIPFLGIYEIGYIINDSVVSADERPERRRYHLTRERLLRFSAIRVMLLIAACMIIAIVFSGNIALCYLLSVCLLLLLLLIHTWFGAVRSPVRFVTFTWLAWVKYLPGLLVLLPFDLALKLLMPVFTVYGAGRVCSYLYVKLAKQETAFPVSRVWFFATAPVAVGLYGSKVYGAEILALLLVLLLYYAVSMLRGGVETRKGDSG